MRAIRPMALLLATAMGAQDAFAGDDPAPNPEILWPVPKPGERADTPALTNSG